MTLPNFLIVGSARSGTTSLYAYLSQHPEIFLPSNKEPHFFVNDSSIGTLEEYESLFSGAEGRKAVGEASTGYLYAKESPPWIKSTLKDPKIIIMLRNPVDVAYSLYWYVRRWNNEPLEFEEALAAESTRMADPHSIPQGGWWLRNYLYMDRVRFHAQVQRYIDTFGKNNVLILLFEDFVTDTKNVCRTVFSHLDVDSEFPVDINRAWNSASMARSELLNTAANKPFPGRKTLKKLLPERLRHSFVTALNSINSIEHPTPALNRETHLKIVKELESDVSNLGNMIGRDLTHWLEVPK